MRAVRIHAKQWWPDWRAWPARVAALALVPMPVRLAILRAVGHQFAPGARIRSGTLVTGDALRLGRDTFVNGDCLIDAHGVVEIGDEVHLGHRVQLLTEGHEPGASSRRAGAMTTMPIAIGDGAWVGAGSILLPGVSIGAGAVIAAGAVVTGWVEPDSMYGGVPAKHIRSLASG